MPVFTWRWACVPQPTCASRIMSLGGMTPRPPSTRRGTMVNADPAATVPRKSRRFMLAIDTSRMNAPRMLLKAGGRATSGRRVPEADCAVTNRALLSAELQRLGEVRRR